MSFAANGEAGDSLTDDVVEVGSIIINWGFFFFRWIIYKCKIITSSSVFYGGWSAMDNQACVFHHFRTDPLICWQLNKCVPGAWSQLLRERPHSPGAGKLKSIFWIFVCLLSCICTYFHSMMSLDLETIKHCNRQNGPMGWQTWTIYTATIVVKGFQRVFTGTNKGRLWLPCVKIQKMLAPDALPTRAKML